MTESTISTKALIALLSEHERVTPLQVDQMLDELRPEGVALEKQICAAMDSGNVIEAEKLITQLSNLWGWLDGDCVEYRARLAWRI